MTLSYADDFLSVEFHRLQEASTKPYCGPYQDRLVLGPEEIEAITESEGMALSVTGAKLPQRRTCAGVPGRIVF